MKALDTPVLLGLLRGNEKAAAAIHAGDPAELATTEVNFAELLAVARLDSSSGRERRLEAVERLRRHLTVLPINAESARAAGSLASRVPSAPAWFILVLGTLEAHSVAEWLVEVPRMRLPRGLTKVKLTNYR